jgi:threonine aldolase
MQFASDNWAGASDRVMAALTEAARTGAPAYGADRWTTSVEQHLAEVFEHDVAVLLVGSGTAANSLALSAFAKPGGVVFCHRQAHVMVDEAGAVEFQGAGIRLVGLDGDHGKIDARAVDNALSRFPPDAVHHGQPVAVSLTQITELGSAYRPDEIAAIAAVAQRREAKVHMDGARFAGAVVALGVSPADLTWRAGVDVLSFGGTKNGCLAAEAIVFFNASDATNAGFARQRSGHGFSKNWFIAAQFDAYLRDGHWLNLARHANGMAQQLVRAIDGSRSARLALKPAANEVFVLMSRPTDEHLRAAGAVYHPWSAEGLPLDINRSDGEVMARLVTSFQTTHEEIERFAAALANAPA